MTKKVKAICNGKIVSGVALNPSVGQKSQIWMEDGEHRTVTNKSGIIYFSNSATKAGVFAAEIKVTKIGDEFSFPDGSYASIILA